MACRGLTGGTSGPSRIDPAAYNTGYAVPGTRAAPGRLPGAASAGHIGRDGLGVTARTTHVEIRQQSHRWPFPAIGSQRRRHRSGQVPGQQHPDSYLRGTCIKLCFDIETWGHTPLAVEQDGG